ncbi:MAG TPA: hypothetical protein VGJ79_08275 [Candidatus Dormibacteraeota bacterium]|jgi:hypothetical protein
MDLISWVIIGVVAFMAIMIVLALSGRTRRYSRPNLQPLAPEAIDRFGASWDRIESHFMDAPEEAVREADALVLALLGEVEHPLADERLPSGVLRARRAAAGKEVRGTEGLRRAMLHYRGVIVDMLGSSIRSEKVRGRREIAS